MTNTTPIYRAYLYTALANHAGMNEEQTDTILSRFDKLADAGSDELAFRVMLEAYGNEDTERACRTVKEAIQLALEKVNKNHVGIDGNPASRLRSLIQRHNRNLEKCCIEINGIPLSKGDIEKVKIRIPGCFKTETFTATASAKTAKLTLEIRY